MLVSQDRGCCFFFLRGGGRGIILGVANREKCGMRSMDRRVSYKPRTQFESQDWGWGGEGGGGGERISEIFYVEIYWC